MSLLDGRQEHFVCLGGFTADDSQMTVVGAAATRCGVELAALDPATKLKTGADCLNVRFATAKDLHEKGFEFVAENAVDQYVNRRVDCHQQIGNLKHT